MVPCPNVQQSSDAPNRLGAEDDSGVRSHEGEQQGTVEGKEEGSHWLGPQGWNSDEAAVDDTQNVDDVPSDREPVPDDRARHADQHGPQ